MRTPALTGSRITKGEKKKQNRNKDLKTKIFNIEHIWDKTECNQINNLFSLKTFFNSLLCRQPTQMLVGEEVQAVSWMRGQGSLKLTNVNKSI